MNSKHVLVTGGSGMIGSRLTSLLLQSGHAVTHLGRSKRFGRVKSFVWDIDNHYLEDGALQNVDVIIHLAGADIGDKRWTAKRKKIIIDSRVKSVALLYGELEKQDHQVKTFISASGSTYYGLFDDDRTLQENDKKGDGFTAEVTEVWEAAADRMKSLGMRVVKLRTAMVLSPEGGALKKLAVPIWWFVGAPLGSGNQCVSWIHVDDLCGMYIKALEDDLIQDTYNAAAPEVVSNGVFTRTLAKALHRPIILPNIPSVVITTMFGEMGSVVLKGNNISSEKIRQTGFEFQFGTLEKALNDIYKE